MRLPVGKPLTVRTAADVFLDSLGNPNTIRAYGIGVGKIAERLGEGRPLAAVADEEIGGAWNCCGAPRRSTPGTRAARRCCLGWGGAGSAAMRRRWFRRGPSG
ncbi:hypothetical protein GCM10010404_93040 [Nonomuraea africana]